jgi:hypothetical protein
VKPKEIGSMRNFLGILMCFVMMVTLGGAGCGVPGLDRGSTADHMDTSGSWPTPELERIVSDMSADTIVSDTALSLFNERHLLRIIGMGQGGFNHDRAFRVQLTGPGGVVLDTVLTKASFADSLDAEFLGRAGLYALDFDFVRSRSLYFNAYVGVDETDYVQPMDLFMTYAGEQKGRMLYWLVPEDIGAQE